MNLFANTNNNIKDSNQLMKTRSQTVTRNGIEIKDTSLSLFC